MCVCVYVCVCIYIHTHSIYIYVHMYTYIHCAYIYMYTYAHMYIVYMYMYTCVYVHTHTHTHTHTHIHTYTYTYIPGGIGLCRHVDLRDGQGVGDAQRVTAVLAVGGVFGAVVHAGHARRQLSQDPAWKENLPRQLLGKYQPSAGARYLIDSDKRRDLSCHKSSKVSALVYLLFTK
jgi:hypothetical protein